MRQSLSGQVPVSHEFVLVDSRPRKQQALLGRPELAGHHSQVVEPDAHLVTAIRCVWRWHASATKQPFLLGVSQPTKGHPVQIRRLAPDVFDSDYAIAGSIKGLAKATTASGRRYPFYWWKTRPTSYAMKPGVAAVFAAARDRVGR